MDKKKIESVECRRCGAMAGCSCIAPHTHEVYVRVRFDGEDGHTELCYERLYDYFESFRPPTGCH